jgi:hypothetical protein
MFGKLKSMFGIMSPPKLERPAPDQITAQITIATQRNERAAANLNQLLKQPDNLMTDVVTDIVGKM